MSDSEYQAYRNSRGKRSSVGVAKSLQDIELGADAVLETQLREQREKEAIARAYAYKLLVEKEAALSAQKQKELESIQEQKRRAEERLKAEEEKARKRKEEEERQQRAEDEKQARILEEHRLEQERARSEKEKADKEKEKSLSSVRSKIDENRKKFEQQQKELEDKRAKEELDRLKQKAIAVERERNRQRMLQANNEAFSSDIAAITSKLEQELAFEKQQKEAFESEHGLSLQNVSKSFLQYTVLPWQSTTNEVSVVPPADDGELEEKPANPILSFFTTSITAPVNLFVNIISPQPSAAAEAEPEKVVNMDSFIYTLGTTGISVIIFLARGKDKGDALFYAANMKFDRKFDLVFNATTEFGRKELIFPCEVIDEVEDGRGYNHADSQPFTFPYENIASKTLHFKLLNKPDLNIQFESAALKNDMLLFFRNFLRQKLQIKQNKLGLDGAQSFLNAGIHDVKKILWIGYGYKKSTSMLGLRKGKNIPVLLVVDNVNHASITIFAAPEEHSIPINEFKNSVSSYFDKNYSPEVFEGMGYSIITTQSLKKCSNVLFLRYDFALELGFQDDEGKTHTEVVCFESKELQDAAGEYLSKTYKKAKSS